MKDFDPDIVSGPVSRSVWKLAWPLMGMHLINGLHGFVDHLLLGHFEGTEANAGLGVAWQLFLVIVVFLSSLFHGMGVLVAQSAGRRDRESVNRVIYHTFLTALLILIFFLAPAGYFASPLLLGTLNISAEVQAHALPYLRVMFMFGTPLFLMFLLNGALQAAGDPKLPLKLAALSNILNILFSYVLITGVGPFPAMGAAGAAAATCMAPLASVLILAWLLLRGELVFGLPKKLTLIPDLEIMKLVSRIGIPSGIQSVLLNLGGVLLIYKIAQVENSEAALGAYTICYTQLFSFVSFASYGLRTAAATVMGQNIGAENPARGKAAVYAGSVMGLGWAVFLGTVYWIFPETLLGWFDATDPAVLEYGSSLLAYLGFSGLVLTVTLALTGGLQGAGETKVPMYIAFLTQIVILLGVCEIYDRMDRLTASAVWSAIFISHLSRFLLTAIVFYRGRWLDIKLEISSEAQA